MNAAHPKMVEVRDLAISFNTGKHIVQALKGVSFSILSGESFGLVGESGSGKTTVLRAIAGLNSDWQGEIEIDGRALSRHPDKAMRRAIQMVFQDPYGSLHPKHTVDRILSEPLIVHGIGDIENRVEETLTQVQLGPSSAFAIRTNSPAASASASPSREL